MTKKETVNRNIGLTFDFIRQSFDAPALLDTIPNNSVLEFVEKDFVKKKRMIQQLSGSGIGSWTKDEMQKLFTEILPEMFQLAADKKLKVETINVNIKDIGKLWDMEVADGKRLVITM